MPGQSPALGTGVCKDDFSRCTWSLYAKAFSPLSSVLQPPKVGSRDGSCPKSWMCIVPLSVRNEKSLMQSKLPGSHL